jgi:hypothetical protein
VLIEQARLEGPSARLASALIWLGLWPSLNRIYLSAVGQFPAKEGEIRSDISELMQAQIGKLELAGVSKIIGTITANVGRDVMRRRVREQKKERLADELEADGPRAPQVAPAAERSLSALVAKLAELVGEEKAKLLGRALFLEESRAELAEELGMAEEAIKKRVQRALAELATKLEKP